MKDTNAEFISANAIRYAKKDELKEYFNVNFIYHDERDRNKLMCASVRTDAMGYDACKNLVRGDSIFVVWCEDNWKNLKLEYIQKVVDDSENLSENL